MRFGTIRVFFHLQYSVVLCALIRQDEKSQSALQKLYDLTLPPCLEGGCVHVNEEGNAATIWWG